MLYAASLVGGRDLDGQRPVGIGVDLVKSNGVHVVVATLLHVFKVDLKARGVSTSVDGSVVILACRAARIDQLFHVKVDNLVGRLVGTLGGHNVGTTDRFGKRHHRDLAVARHRDVERGQGRAQGHDIGIYRDRHRRLRWRGQGAHTNAFGPIGDRSRIVRALFGRFFGCQTTDVGQAGDVLGGGRCV
ncbi:MAG: hypothetical protein Q7U67_05790, partial [Hydrogenophaga sp.]|nr:hypothetical protein [Hydrogenophaga sp.]